MRAVAFALLAIAVLACDDPAGAPADGGAADHSTADRGPADAADAAVDVGPDATSVDAAVDGAPGDSGCTFVVDALDDNLPAPPRHTPRWAFRPWISKDISDRDDTFAFVDGFRERDIPVGVVVLDSPWETHYNTFIPNPTRYPDFEQMVADLRVRDVRVVLWITQMVNQSSFDFEVGGDRYVGPSPNRAEGERCGFFVNEGELFTWWKGLGSGVDFFNPRAATWWHRQQDRVLDAGIAGWKLDFGEQYLTTDPLRTAAGPVAHQAYSERYYEDFLTYGVHRRGADEFLTMVRPYDASYQFSGRFYARPEHAPVGWVGDNRRNWDGLVDALDHLFRSAQAGYVVIGSDIGGYLDFEDVGNLPGPPVAFDWDVFVRWLAQGALTPFMQLHGRANLTPWTMPEEAGDTVAIYRYWAHLHDALGPFFYSLAEQAYAGGTTIMRPIGAGPEAWAGDWRYMLGEAFLVAPLIAAGGVRDVALPEGARWYDWWRPADDALAGGQTLVEYDARDPQRIPLFVREGALVPLDVRSGVNELGDAHSAGHLTVLVWPGAAESRFALVDVDEAPTELRAQAAADAISVIMSRAVQPALLRVRWDDAAGPAAVQVDGVAAEAAADWEGLVASQSGYWPDPARRAVWVKLALSAEATTARLERTR
ncbi:MAG: glycoside hydrolase family 31 protein [Myxococcales bacterium]|nr:glycoside hydrolase family 31 protein [Myxococcales bacterium]